MLVVFVVVVGGGGSGGGICVALQHIVSKQIEAHIFSLVFIEMGCVYIGSRANVWCGDGRKERKLHAIGGDKLSGMSENEALRRKEDKYTQTINGWQTSFSSFCIAVLVGQADRRKCKKKRERKIPEGEAIKQSLNRDCMPFTIIGSLYFKSKRFWWQPIRFLSFSRFHVPSFSCSFLSVWLPIGKSVELRCMRFTFFLVHVVSPEISFNCRFFTALI